MASQTSWKTRWETRPQTSQEGGHSIPDQMGEKLGDKKTRPRRRTQMKDKLGDKAGDKRKTRPARRTQHPIQGWHTKKALRTPAVNCLKKKRYADTHFASLLATLSLQDNDSQWPWPRDQKMLQKRGRMVPRLTLCSLCCLYCPYALPPLPLTSWCYETVTQMPFVLGWLHWLYIVCWIIESCHQESNVAMLVCNVDTADKSVTQCDRWQDVMMWCDQMWHCAAHSDIVKHSNLAASPRLQTVWQHSRRFWLALAHSPLSVTPIPKATFTSRLNSRFKQTLHFSLHLKKLSKWLLTHHIPEILKSSEEVKKHMLSVEIGSCQQCRLRGENHQWNNERC